MASPPLRPGQRFKRRPGLDLACEHLDELLAVGADWDPATHEPDGAEQATLDHERVELRDTSTSSIRCGTRAQEVCGDAAVFFIDRARRIADSLMIGLDIGPTALNLRSMAEGRR
jgi:hypothetical protein